ncbi:MULTISPECIES: hypothetical protein [unclassified Pseudomonas]|uniref:hypothetical protein n=1 Tax=unclassified Pseudomonas TaxID=196821 RepID=UPI000BA421B2|nr:MULTISPECIES: hypothetical protein [unclassified Pseudomonas]POA17692.1 hypothetical protein C1886_20635 [Pseudomonas sp. FW300-N1A1]
MRIVAALACTFMLSLTLPSMSFAGSDCDDADSASELRNCLKNNSDYDNDNKGKGNCNANGNCDKSKNKGKNKGDDDDYAVSCMDINNLTLRRECIEKRRD